jgi:phage terminase small subunit
MKDKMPAWLRRPSKHLQGEARAEWLRIAPVLWELIPDQLIPLDRSSLEMYCMNFDMWESAWREMQAEPGVLRAEILQTCYEGALLGLARFTGSILAADYLERRCREWQR